MFWYYAIWSDNLHKFGPQPDSKGHPSREHQVPRCDLRGHDDIIVEIDEDKVLVQPHLEEALLKQVLQSLKELGIEPESVQFIPCG